MCPPHCGQTRLMMEEIMLAFGSPGIVSMILIVASYVPRLLSGEDSGLNDARRSQGLRTTVNLPMSLSLSSAPCWLAADFVWVTSPAAASLRCMTLQT